MYANADAEVNKYDKLNNKISYESDESQYDSDHDRLKEKLIAYR